MTRLCIAALAGLLVAATPPPRTEVPIKAATQPNGVKRYTVELVIDGRTIEAGLDTGSTGLRVMAAAVPTTTGRGGIPVHRSYNAGVDLAGVALDLPVTLGGVSAPHLRIARVDRVTCVRRLPDCPAEGADPATFRIMADGIAGQGFVAIMGIGMAEDPVTNPLVQLGIHRWIVELPRPGDPMPGRLILNPRDDEIARYRQFALGGRGNMVAACIAAAPAFKLCRPAMLDTGAPGLRVQGGTAADVLPAGTAAQIAIGDDTSMATMPVTIGRRDLASGMRLDPSPRGPAALSLGVAPYLHWSVLYDADRRRIGVAER